MKDLVIAFAVGLLVSASPATFLAAPQATSGGAKASNASRAAFEKILEQYYVIQNALAGDTIQGVEQASQEIVEQAAAAEKKASQKGPDFAAIKTSAEAMSGKNLKQARTQFFELSKPIIAELKRDPSWRDQGYTYTCSMAKKSWAQAQKEIRNPYYGKSMLKCGEPL
jgi:hypothetical protein